MHSKVFLLFVSFSFSISTTAFTQYAFDVKTLLEEKGDLQNYKQGLLSSISNSGWASVKDVGEDFFSLNFLIAVLKKPLRHS